MGWSVIDQGYDEWELVASGVLGLEQGKKETFGAYRKRLIAYWVETFPEILVQYEPELIASETIPIVGGSSPFANTQRVLGLLAITVCQVLTSFYDRTIEWREYGANTVKVGMTGNGKATKVAIRNAVCKVFPELEPVKKTLQADETDAIAVGLIALGYKQ